jgi:hypothetical protein
MPWTPISYVMTPILPLFRGFSHQAGLVRVKREVFSASSERGRSSYRSAEASLARMVFSRVKRGGAPHQPLSCHGRVGERASPDIVDHITYPLRVYHVPAGCQARAGLSRGSPWATTPTFCRTASQFGPHFSIWKGGLVYLVSEDAEVCKTSVPKLTRRHLLKGCIDLRRLSIVMRAFARLLYGTGPHGAAGLVPFGWDLSPRCQRW